MTLVLGAQEVCYQCSNRGIQNACSALTNHVCIPAFVCMFVGRLSKTLYNPVSPNKKKITRLNCFHLQNNHLFFCSVWHTEITLRGSVLQVILIILYYFIII